MLQKPHRFPEMSNDMGSSFAWLLSLVMFWLTLSGCRPQPSPQSKTQVRIAFASVPWVNALLAIYSNKLPGIAFSRTEPSGSANAYLDYIDAGLAELSFVQADMVYMAFTRGTEARLYPHRKLRGMAVLHMSALHFVVANGSDFRSLKYLRGKRIGIGTPGSSTELMMPLLLAQLGINPSELQLERYSIERAAAELRNGTLDAEFFFSAFPVEAAQAVFAVPGLHLVSIPGPQMSKLRDKYSFLRPVTIPAGTYGQSDNIETLGVDFLFVCHEDVNEDVVYQMLSVFFDSVTELSKLRPALRTISFNQSPGTPIPLHPGAARFYREHQLFN